MVEAVSISKSVARAFQVLELFRAHRQPLTAADIGRQLTLPQPSTRALLKTLVSLGYLVYTEKDRTYWPTGRVLALGQWLRGEQRLPVRLTLALHRIAGLAGETTSLCGLRDGNVEILHVCKAQHPVALQLETGVGVAAWRTAVGRALLATLPDAEVTALLGAWLRQERTPAGRRVLQSLPRELKRARADGFLAGYNLFLKAVGAVCVPLPAARYKALPAPLVVAVAGLSERIRPREPALLRMIRSELRRAA
jgi:DNA-binding IclR family transcriptional regulator